MTTRGTPSYLVHLPSSPLPRCMGNGSWLIGKGLALALVYKCGEGKRKAVIYEFDMTQSKGGGVA